MKHEPARLVAVVVLLGASGCASREPDETPFEPESVRAYGAAQVRCDAYVSELVKPVIARLRLEVTISGMRHALVSMPEHEFSVVALRVQQSAQAIVDFDPLTEKSQLEVSKILYEKMVELPSFSSSRCGAELREVVMDHLYWKLGRESAPSVVELRKTGVQGHTELQWVLMTSLLGPE